MYRHLQILSLSLLASGCAVPPPDEKRRGGFGRVAIAEVGTVPRPPGHGGRDVGFSGMLDGRSVWIFGDTFLPAIPVFDGGSLFSVRYNAHFRKYVALYLPGMDPIFRMQTADVSHVSGNR